MARFAAALICMQAGQCSTSDAVRVQKLQRELKDWIDNSDSASKHADQLKARLDELRGELKAMQAGREEEHSQTQGRISEMERQHAQALQSLKQMHREQMAGYEQVCGHLMVQGGVGNVEKGGRGQPVLAWMVSEGRPSQQQGRLLSDEP